MKKKVFVFSAIFLCVVAILFFFFSKEKSEYQPATELSLVQENGYVGSEACRECHPQAFEQWKQSDHFKAMQIATDSTVLGNFNNVTYTADGVTSRFFKKENQFFIHTEDENGAYRDFQVYYTFGYYPLQQYITQAQGGRWQVFRQSWDSRKNRWFHQYEKQKIPHDDWLHWTGNAQNWNMMCASCHSTNLKKNYNPETDTYHTTYSELTVGCEACHGQGKAHTQLMKSSPQWEKNKNLLIEKSTEMTQNQVLGMCFSCHARRGELTQFHTTSPEILDNYIPEIPAVEIYFPDGQAQDEVYKYTSFLESKMYQQGVSCTDCHHAHTGKLKKEGNSLCLQCHTPNYATPEHTHHKENTPASDCRSCHMPTRTYMGNDVRHDHNFAVPRPDLSAKYPVPNACNACHSEKSAQWAAQAVNKWYGTERKKHFAEALILGSQLGQSSVEKLSELLSDGQTPQIIRATAVHYLGQIPSEESLQLIKKELLSHDTQTRYRAVMALMNFPLQTHQSSVIPMLKDSVRAVRVAVANLLLAQMGFEQARKISGFEKARQELEEFLLSQSDFASGSASLADYYTRMGDTQRAILFYERALKKDKALNYIRLNLATLYSGENQPEKARKILEKALEQEPQNAQVHYYLALLLSELEAYPQAKIHFEKAIQLGADSPRVQRNYQLLLKKMQQGVSSSQK